MGKGTDIQVTEEARENIKELVAAAMDMSKGELIDRINLLDNSIVDVDKAINKIFKKVLADREHLKEIIPDVILRIRKDPYRR